MPRKSTKRKSRKRKSPQRKLRSRRESQRRRSPKRKLRSKRKSTRRKSPKRSRRKSSRMDDISDLAGYFEPELRSPLDILTEDVYTPIYNNIPRGLL